MALTRKFLSARGIEAEIIDEIITAHSDTVNALKTERDDWKAKAESLPTVKKELDELRSKYGDKDYKDLYEKEHAALEDYKKVVAKNATTAAKKAAFEKLLRECGVSEKRIAAILKVESANFDDLEIKDGKFTKEDDIKKSITDEYSDFIPKSETKGAKVPKPPKTTSGEVKSKKEIMEIKDTTERQAEWAKYLENQEEGES